VPALEGVERDIVAGCWKHKAYLQLLASSPIPYLRGSDPGALVHDVAGPVAGAACFQGTMADWSMTPAFFSWTKMTMPSRSSFQEGSGVNENLSVASDLPSRRVYSYFAMRAGKRAVRVLLAFSPDPIRVSTRSSRRTAQTKSSLPSTRGDRGATLIWRLPLFLQTSTSKSNCCKEISPELCRAGCADYSSVTCRLNCCKEMLPGLPFGTGCADYSSVTCKLNRYKGISPGNLFRIGCANYSSVTRKSNLRKEIWRSDCSIVTRKFNRSEEIWQSRFFRP
jgi:hypothetical protein